ncbi:preprotein translocase subunit YajC [Microbacterium sp.]|mgnify:CR=1 FL=1|uniref:preprotein translocase subunit YajC n=1 Tax=Microbacterium sp. TaxID=51671 RepID=UPI0032214AE1
MFLATAQTAEVNPAMKFFADYGLIIILVVLLGFMFWSSRRRMQRTKAEQEAKSRAMVPGVKVLLQGGLYGTLVEFDGDDLSKPARVELAPGVSVEVHSQGILRVVDPVEETPAEAPEIESIPGDDTVPDADDPRKP